MTLQIPEQQRRLRQHLERQGISDRRVLDVMESTRRDLFVPESHRSHAYDDIALPLGSGQTISQPYIVALMTQALRPAETDHVLEIGTGSGYQTAILAQLCRDVVSIERLAELSRPAQEVLGRLGIANVQFEVGDGTLGWPAGAPYDGIIVTAAAPDVPAPLYRQLAPGGRLVIPIGDDVQQTLMCYTKRQDGYPDEQRLCACRFVKLIGDAGWPPESESDGD